RSCCGGCVTPLTFAPPPTEPRGGRKAIKSPARGWYHAASPTPFTKVSCGLEPRNVAELRDSARIAYPSVGFTGLSVRTRAAATLKTANGNSASVWAMDVESHRLKAAQR